MRRKRRPFGFTLVELVIVVVIIGIIAAIAVPRISRGARGAGESALRGNLTAMRNAIDLYAAEHGGVFPGAKAAGGTFGAAASEDAFKNQLSKYTDRNGLVSDTKTATQVFGPYMRRVMPPLPVGVNAGSTTVKMTNVAPAVDILGGFGWVYNYTTGEIIANADDTDEGGVVTYDQY